MLTQYLYLGSEGRVVPIAKIDGPHAAGNATGAERLLFIHADYRGQPLAMTDAARHVVWRGRPDVWGDVAQDSATQSAVLNLRLPGQYYDAETGLHDNGHRSYDPRPESPMHGRYLSPDPLGFPDGPDAYAYGGGDPVNKIDSMGLYQEDIHYYMTFFLALAAGIDYNTAHTIALADQYVDANPQTRPVDIIPGTTIINPLTVFMNQQRLLLYHFVLSDAATGTTNPDYENSNVNIVVASPSLQLKNLLNASTNAKDTPCAKDQFFGEYLHAFEDTYGHRQKDNTPYDAENFLGMGVGHGLSDSSEPDYTYDDPSEGWTVREARTQDMEIATFDKLKAFAPSATPAIDDVALVAKLKDFNDIIENDEEGEAGMSQKLNFLNQEAKDLGLHDASGQDIDFKSDDSGFDVNLAAKNRLKNLCDANGQRLKQSDYIGTLLPHSACPS